MNQLPVSCLRINVTRSRLCLLHACSLGLIPNGKSVSGTNCDVVLYSSLTVTAHRPAPRPTGHAISHYLLSSGVHVSGPFNTRISRPTRSMPTAQSPCNTRPVHQHQQHTSLRQKPKPSSSVIAIAPTTEAAMALGPSLMTVFIVFGGYYVNPDNTPVIFRWIPKASLIRWAFQGLCINEFKGLQFEQQHSYDTQTGEQVLERDSLGGIRIADTLAAQGRILMFWYWLTYLLKKNRSKYQQLLPPSEEAQSEQQLE